MSRWKHYASNPKFVRQRKAGLMASCHFSLHLNIMAHSGLKNRWTSEATISRIQPPNMYLVLDCGGCFFTFALFYARESECLNAGNLYSWNGESWAMEPRIQLTESAIPFTIWIQNPCSIDKDWNPVPGIRNPRPSVHRGVSKTPNGLPASEKQRNKVSFCCNFENLPRLCVLFRVSVSNFLSCSE